MLINEADTTKNLTASPDKKGQAPMTSATSGSDGCGNGCDLPEIEVSDRHRQLQAAAFAALLDTGQPVTRDHIATQVGLTSGEVDLLLTDFDTVGRVRFDDDGAVVGIAGLSIEATRHRLDLGGTIRWTWCALDAIGILGALARPATYTAQVPDTDDVLEIGFSPDGPEDSAAVVFMADGYSNDSVVESWCPSVNLFPDTATAQNWAHNNQVTGQPIPVSALATNAAAMWTPVVAAAVQRSRPGHR